MLSLVLTMKNIKRSFQIDPKSSIMIKFILLNFEFILSILIEKKYYYNDLAK